MTSVSQGYMIEGVSLHTQDERSKWKRAKNRKRRCFDVEKERKEEMRRGRGGLIYIHVLVNKIAKSGNQTDFSKSIHPHNKFT
jgi:hypothetical protein